MNRQQRDTMKLLGIALIAGITLTILLHLTEGAAAPPNFL
jgi:hypothetical protein